MSKSTLALEDLIGAPVQSIGQAQEALEASKLRTLRSYLVKGEDGQLRPQTLDIQTGGADPQTVSVPLMGLVQLPSLVIDEATVEMVSELCHQVQVRPPKGSPPPLPNAPKPAPQLRCRLTSAQASDRNPRMSTFSIKLTVSSVEANEATQRIRDRLMGYMEAKASRAKRTKPG